MKRPFNLFASVLLLAGFSCSCCFAQSGKGSIDAKDRKQADIDQEFLPDKEAPPEYLEELIESGELAWIELRPNGKLVIQGTNDDEWIYVSEELDHLHVEIRDLAGTTITSKKTYPFPQAQISEIEILAKDGNDRVSNHTWIFSVTWAGTGCDFVETGGYIRNIIHGGPDPDRIISYGNETEVFGEGGNDGIFHTWGNCVLNGGSGNDFIEGGNGFNKIRGEEGDDTLLSLWGHCDVKGGPGDDLLVGSRYNDVLVGDDTSTLPTDGTDTLFGRDGLDFLQGGGGPDTLVGGAGADTIYGNRGDDWIYARDSTRDLELRGDQGKDTYCRDEVDPSFGIDSQDIDECTLPEPPVPNPRYDRSKFESIFGK